MNKPLLVYQAPVFTRSGYGDHARDILRSLFELDRYDIKIVPTRWGNTPQNQADPNTEFGKKMLSNIATQVNRKPDIFMQMSVANEFEPKGFLNSFFNSKFVQNKNRQIKDLKNFIKNWNGKHNLVFVTQYVVISEILNYEPSSGEMVVIDKKFKVVDTISIPY